MEFIDTHSHNNDPSYEGCVEQIVERAISAGITHILQADIDSRERDSMFSLVERFPEVMRPMLGLYPGSVDKNWIDEIEKMLPYRERGIVAVGEIGLDYHFSTEFKEEQKDAFKAQLELASKWDLPVNIHLRDATDDFFLVMDSCRGLGLRGNIHAFSGSYETFQRIQKYGDWSVGIGGVVTFKKAGIAEDIKKIPLERIVLETDSPYLAPTPLRGTRNESANIPLIAAKIAEAKGIPLAVVARTTTENAKKLFNL